MTKTSNPFAWSPGPRRRVYKDGYEVLCIYRGIEIIAPIGWDVVANKSHNTNRIGSDMAKGVYSGNP